MNSSAVTDEQNVADEAVDSEQLPSPIKVPSRPPPDTQQLHEEEQLPDEMLHEAEPGTETKARRSRLVRVDYQNVDSIKPPEVNTVDTLTPDGFSKSIANNNPMMPRSGSNRAAVLLTK